MVRHMIIIFGLYDTEKGVRKNLWNVAVVPVVMTEKYTDGILEEIRRS